MVEHQSINLCPGASKEKYTVRYGNFDRHDTWVAIDIHEGEVIGASYKIGSTTCTGAGNIDELRRLKEILNSIPEL